MKHLLLSVDGVINGQTSKPFSNIIDILKEFKGQNKDREVVIISARGINLNKIPAELNPIKISFDLRGSGLNLVKFIETKLKKTLDDIIVIGSKAEDMHTAKHLKAILLRAEYAKINNPLDTIYGNDYGIPLKEVDSIKHFFNAFTSVENPWYCKLEVDQNTTFIALTSANTFTDGLQASKIKDAFKEFIKNSNQKYALPFTYYSIVAAHLMSKTLAEFDYWDIYPSSGKDSVNSDLLNFAKKTSHTFGKTFQTERIFLRTKNSVVRHMLSLHKRLEDGCNEQFKTMIINPYYKNKLKGKNICIIDDFTRHGTSCETARLLLLEAGANKILFIAMGKFGASGDYNKYTYELNGDIFSKIDYIQKARTKMYGLLNDKANKDFIESLGKWI